MAVDTSQDLYDVEAYFLALLGNGSVYSLVMGGRRSQVVPLKLMSISKLELQAVVVGVRMLLYALVKEHSLKVKERFV